MVKNLRQLRENAGISQQKLASAVGISQQSVNKYENHNIEPDIAALSAIADFFGTSIDYLVGHSEVDRVIEDTSPCDLNADELKLVMAYRKLSPSQKKSIHLVIENYTAEQYFSKAH